jgi:hypothetical protein
MLIDCYRSVLIRSSLLQVANTGVLNSYFRFIPCRTNTTSRGQVYKHNIDKRMRRYCSLGDSRRNPSALHKNTGGIRWCGKARRHDITLGPQGALQSQRPPLPRSLCLRFGRRRWPAVVRALNVPSGRGHPHQAGPLWSSNATTKKRMTILLGHTQSRIIRPGAGYGDRRRVLKLPEDSHMPVSL